VVVYTTKEKLEGKTGYKKNRKVLQLIFPYIKKLKTSYVFKFFKNQF